MTGIPWPCTIEITEVKCRRDLLGINLQNGRVSRKPHCLPLVHRLVAYCVEMKHLGGLSENIFGNFQLGCTLLIPGLKAWSGYKEHFQRAGSGGGKVWGGEGRHAKKSFL